MTPLPGLSEQQTKILLECHRRANGKAWEPRGGTDTKGIQNYVAKGYLKVVDGRCMFERLKDAMVTWTDAGRAAVEAHLREHAMSETVTGGSDISRPQV